MNNNLRKNLKYSEKSINNGVMNLAELSWKDVDRLSKEKTVFFIPVSPIEAHGPHLPLGTDVFIAIQIANEAAKKLKEKKADWFVVITPEISYGFADLGKTFPGNISIRQSTLKSLIIDVCENLAIHGAKYIVLVDHHLAPRHQVAIDEGIMEVMESYDVKIISPCLSLLIKGEIAKVIAMKTNCNSADFGFSGKYNGHGGAIETSAIMYLYPELINKETINSLPIKNVELRKDLKGSKSFKEMGMELGYTGNPKLATERLGKIFLEASGAVLAKIIIEMLKGNDVFKEATTIFSYISMFHTEEWKNKYIRNTKANCHKLKMMIS